MTDQPPPLKNWPHTFDQNYVFKRLGIVESTRDQQVVREEAQAVYNVVAAQAFKKGIILSHIFRSSSSRTQILYEWRKRMPRVPPAVRNHVPNIDLLSGALYKYLTCIHDELLEDFAASPKDQANQAAKASGKTGRGPGRPPAPVVPGPARSTIPKPAKPEDQRFEYQRPFIVPNGDVQIIRADYPDMPIAIRVSDFLTDKGNPLDVCPDGDWINIANIEFELFRANLTQEGYWADGDTVWLSPYPLGEIDTTKITNPQPGEARLTSFNLASTLLRTIREHWPKLRNPSPEPFESSRRSPLPRPSLTIIIRTGVPRGGALAPNQPAIARPTEQLGGNTVRPNRRMEQVARYAANRHAKTKRKRGEAEWETGRTENEVEGDGPIAQRRKRIPQSAASGPVGLAPGTAPGPAFAPEPAFAPGPAIDPNSLAPAGQDPPAGEFDEEAFLADLDPTMFNDQAILGDDSALQAFFEQNKWSGDEAPMDEEM
ncbi:hypothetical protein N7517_007098 [Penicillium concentricum]|uniref:Uncharacterized protein n=1 Tax=Penicillium concentricum TaxID=293559 RepID=A0A9W9SBI1_9EURO|nr:uncharacterized protein N7517_007098 [Penicillium concentricum]KAJ5375092.1 hypothetical protein N7517_007098 [Penicillium concentricum]